jgi:hypothetical protein
MEGTQMVSEHSQSPPANELRFRLGHSEWQFGTALSRRREFLGSESVYDDKEYGRGNDGT